LMRAQTCANEKQGIPLHLFNSPKLKNQVNPHIFDA
jgi:hypothetical protein